MIIVTGAAGFIGSNIVKALNARGCKDILAVDDLTNGHQFLNLVDCEIKEYLDKQEFLSRIISREGFGTIEAILHQGACSDTTVWDGRYMMENNYEYSRVLLAYAAEREIPFLYASSAAVYGGNQTFVENPVYEMPLNVYGYSKLLFDQWVRRQFSNSRSQIAGFRYFNVYGSREQHKQKMASVAFHFDQQIKTTGNCRLFEGCDGYGNGEQRRDFIFVEDVVKVNLWFLDHPDKSGIFNVGTGKAATFNAVANAVIQCHQRGSIEYIPFPEHLKGHYQSFTEADISALRKIGYEETFMSIDEGVRKYLSGASLP